MSEEQPAPEYVRPEWLPEKFANEQAMVDSYAELEKKQSQKAPEGITKDPEKVAETSGTNLDLSEFYTEYADGGSLSEDSYKKLAGAGLTQSDVDRFITLESAERGREAEALYENIEGGANAYNQAVAWAKVEGNIDASYEASYNEIMYGQNSTARGLMMNDLMDKWKASGGFVVEPQGMNIENTPTNIGPQKDVFATQSELTNVMNSPEYKQNESFRQQVAAKMARSTI